MKISFYPTDLVSPKCLVLVGGSGDTSEGFDPLVQAISNKLIDYSICTFSFSTSSKTESILDVQARELKDVIGQLTTDNHFKQIDIFSTSMGAYATIKLLLNNHHSKTIYNVILYDPADYYLSARFVDSNDVTWSGTQLYNPTKKVISDELKDVKGDSHISVVHLTLRNYGYSGYISDNFKERGLDHIDGYPRLSTNMVRAMFDKVPLKNRGKYLKQPNVTHAILRDGNISANLETVAQTIFDLLAQ